MAAKKLQDVYIVLLACKLELFWFPVSLKIFIAAYIELPTSQKTLASGKQKQKARNKKEMG